MLSHPYISVIIPIFNAESYLVKCVNSILAQSFADFELILVDDGSIDNSGAICDEYAQRDARVRTIHQPNGGVSTARNLGIDQARGEYLTFVDADDYLAPNFLQSFDADDARFDIYVQGVTLVKGDKVQSVSLTPADLKDMDSMRDYVGNALPYTPQGYPFRMTFGKLLRRSLFEEVRYNPEISMLEDYIANVQLYRCANTMRVVGSAGYYYVQSHSVLSRRRHPVERYMGWNQLLHEELYNLSCQWHAPEIFGNVLDARLYFLYLQFVRQKDYSLSDRCKVLHFIHDSLHHEGWEDVRLTHPELRIIKALSSAWLAYVVLRVRGKFR